MHLSVLLVPLIVLLPLTLPSLELQAGQSIEVVGMKATVVEFRQLPYVQNEYTAKFSFPDVANPKYVELRAFAELDRYVAAGKTEFEKQVLLLDWAQSRINYGTPEKTVGRDPFAIIASAKKEQEAFCVQYAALLCTAANALGWPCRIVEVGNHTWTDLWSNQYGKWMHFDPTGPFYVAKDGIPISTREYRDAMFGDKKGVERIIHGRHTSDRMKGYAYLLYVPNNDYTTKLGGWFMVKDKNTDKEPLMQATQVPDSGKDLDFPINQAAMAVTASATGLEIALKTLTPNFAGFKVRIDEKAWADNPGTASWSVHPGKNVFEAKSVNKYGVDGYVSRIVLEIK